jgi:hypothetical protein
VYGPGGTHSTFDHNEQGKVRAEALAKTLNEDKEHQLPIYTVRLNEAMRESAIYQGFTAFAIEKVPPALQKYAGREETTLGQTISKVWDGIKTKEFRERMNTQLFDRPRPVRTLIGDVPYKLLRNEKGVNVSLEAAMRHGMLKWSSNSQALTTDTTKQGFVPWLETLGKDANKFLWWMAAKNAEILEGQGREKWLGKAERDEIYRWAGATDKTEWLQKAQEFDQWNKSFLNVTERAGLIDGATRSEWERDFYLPFYRLKEDPILWHEFLTAPQKSKKFISSGIKQLIGGNFKLGDPLENILKNWFHLTQESVRNVTRATIAEWAQHTAPGLITEVEFKDLHVFRRGTGTNKSVTYVTKKDQRNVLVYQRDGKPVYIQVEDADIFNAMSGVDTNMLDGVLAKVMSTPKRALTFWATFGATFKVANTIRDVVSTALMERNFNPFMDAIKGLRAVWQQNPDYVRLMAAGGSTLGSGYTQRGVAEEAAKTIRGVLNREQGNVLFKTARSAWEWWEKVGEASENAARVMTFASRTRRGESTLDAAFAARDLLDFQNGGASAAVQFLIHTIPFLGARTQALYKLGGTALSDDAAVRKNFFLRGTMLMLASIALWYAYKDDDRYKELEEYDRMTYYHWWVGDKHFRLPKPFEIGSFFSSIPEAFLNYVNGTEDGKHVMSIIGKSINGAFALDIPQAFKPLMEQWANKSFFTDRPIVGEHLQGLQPSEQADPWTPESAKAAGKVLGVSPNRIKALAEGYFAMLGTMAMAGTDFVMKTVGDYPEDAEKRIDDMPLVGRFIREADNPRYTRYQSKFYELFDEYDKVAKTMVYYKGLGDAGKAMKMAEENRPLLSVGKGMAETKEQLRKIRANMRVIANSPSLSSEEKTQRLDRFVEQRNRLVKAAYERASTRMDSYGN